MNMKRTAKSLALILAVVMIIAMFPLTASAASYKPGKVKISSFSVSKVSTVNNTATVTIKWKKVSKATGYWVYERNSAGKWVLIKKLGKNYVGIKVKQVPAGQRAFRVRAVRKVKGKIYKGTMSVIKSKFIASKLTLEKYISKIEGEETSYSFEDSGIPVDVVITGNTVNMTYHLPGSLDSATISEILDELKSDMVGMCKNVRLEGGIKGVAVTVNMNYGDTVLGTRTYKEGN